MVLYEYVHIDGVDCVHTITHVLNLLTTLSYMNLCTLMILVMNTLLHICVKSSDLILSCTKAFSDLVRRMTKYKVRVMTYFETGRSPGPTLLTWFNFNPSMDK